MAFVARWFALFCLFVSVMSTAEPSLAAGGRVKSLKVTLLSTMLADGDELGEWGFAALVEADGHRILFDTGEHSDLVLKNAASLKLDLTTVPEVILSHWHSDHVGGFLALRDSVRTKAPMALAKTHVADGIFLPRRAIAAGPEVNGMIAIKPQYEKTGGTFVVHAGPVQLYPGVWLTGPVPRRYPEHNGGGRVQVQTAKGWAEDDVPDDMSLILDTEQGLVVVTGCGHAGVVNICAAARDVIRPARIHALIGGIHLYNASEQTLAWTAEQLHGFGIDNLIGAHCTGIETVYRFRKDLGLARTNAVVGAVGAGFELGKGINPGEIAK